MASLFDVSLRPSEPADQEISKAMLGTLKIRSRVHGSQKVVLRYLSIKGGDQACETFRTNHGINFEFLHVLLHSPDRTVSLSIPDEVAESHHRGCFNTAQKTFIERHQFRDDLAATFPSSWGTHNPKFGVDYNNVLVKSFLEFASRGQFNFPCSPQPD